MNIAEILRKYGKKGDELYSPLYGKVTLKEIGAIENIRPIVVKSPTGANAAFSCCGMFSPIEPDGECVLFPSQDCRDWDEYVKQKEAERCDKVSKHVVYDGRQYIVDNIEDDWLALSSVVIGHNVYNVKRTEVTPCKRFDPHQLCPYDKVLVRDTDADYWKANFFSHIRPKEERCDDESDDYKYSCVEDAYCECIPYNDETKHLVGTTNEAPEFYR